MVCLFLLLLLVEALYTFVYQKLYKYAEDYCLKAKEYALLSCDDYYISHSFLNLARIYSVQKDYQKSIDYYNKALDIAKQIKNKKNKFILTPDMRITDYLLDKEYIREICKIYMHINKNMIKL